MRRVLRAGWRPLPLAIAAMALLVLVKSIGLAGGMGPSIASIGATARQSVLPSAIAAESKPAAAPASKPAAPAEPEPAPPAAVAEAGPSEAERALLTDLRARREQLEGRERALESRDGLLKAAERGLSDRLDQLAALQARLEGLEKNRRERDEANWRGLVKTYEAMRPRDAAAIFNELEQPVLMQMLDRMKEAKAAAVLAAMQPDRARAATAQLAQWRVRAGGPQG